MKSQIKDLISVFLIQLVLTIPFYVASVYAAIDRTTVKGGNGIEGFAKATDFLNFNIQASITNDTITNEQVVLGSNIRFDRCTPSGNGSECTLRFPSNGTESFESRAVSFTINLFDNNRTRIDTKSSSITIDNKPPQIRLSVPQNRFSSQQNVVINYEVTDFACDDSSCSGRCVGIKNIEFNSSDNTFQQTVEVTTNSCTNSSSITIDINSFREGMNSVFARASDKFNQFSSVTSVTFTVDATGPIILSNSFAITRRGINLNTFSPNRIPVDIFVNISASDLNLNSVTADLSSLNPSPNLRNARASCTRVEDNLSVCRWSIELNPGTGGSKTIVINASDTSGNKESVTINKQLTLDDKGPIVQSLSTLTTAGSTVLARPSGNTVTAVFDEATGLNPEDVFLHVGSSRLSASSCNKQSNWVCTWNNVNFVSSTQMSIDTDTTDVLGNAVSGSTNIGVTIDNKPPVLRGINISNVDGLTQAFPGFFKIGDKIEVVANLTEDNDISATADFSKFISGASKVAGSCERIQADEHICTWLTDSINLQANDVITFNFSDSASNTLIVTRSLRTFGLENATVPDLWSNEVECSPKTIDRQLGPLINQRVFCQVRLTPKSTRRAVSTIFISPASCTGGSSIVQSVDTFNTEVESTSPIIKLTLKKDEFRINNANLSCSFNLFSRIGGTTDITKNPEIENVKINIEFFNLPLGELNKVTQDKIEQAKKDAEGIWKIIGTLNKLMFYAKKICQLLSTLYNIVALLYGIAFKLGIADIAAQKTALGFFTITPTAVAGCSGQTNARLAVQSTWQGLNKFCDIVTCKQTFLWGPTVQNWINNAPLLIGPGQYLGPKTEVKGEGPFGQEVVPIGNVKSITAYDYIKEVTTSTGGKPRPVSEYMDPNHNLIVATLFACLPGIIYGLDKYRQVKCLYADCLQNAVGREGLPVTACEDQKAYATCKYVYSELFAVFPWTAVLDHFLGIIKNALSNPFSIIGIAASIGCTATCQNPNAETRLSTWTACEYARLFNQLGVVIGNVKNIIDEGFKVRTDYCSRLKQNEKASQPTEPIQKTSQGSGSETTTKK